MAKLAILTYFISLTSTYVGLAMAQKFSATVAIGAAGISALFAVAWFQYKEKRVPLEKEFTKFYVTYSTLVFTTFFVFTYLAPSGTTAGIMTIVILAVAYPGTMRILFNEKMLSKQLGKQSG